VQDKNGLTLRTFYVRMSGAVVIGENDNAEAADSQHDGHFGEWYHKPKR